MGTLIEIDAPDGAGKSTLARMLADELSKTSPVTLMRVNAFDVCAESRAVGEEFKLASPNLAPDSIEHNNYFLYAAYYNYKYVQELLKEGESVVIDSSLVRAIAFARVKGSEGSYSDTVEKFLSGALNSGVTPDVRVFLVVEPEDLLNNLVTRGKLDEGDPTCLEEVKGRIRAYQEALEIVRSRDADKTKYLELTNPRSENPVAAAGELVQRIVREASHDPDHSGRHGLPRAETPRRAERARGTLPR